ncbi:hypothetical protein C8R43DRAFT_892614 [Mycena crocata]|nr:hypothetical protein C8R43DRAFT_892614 [Mycena crocata]
MKRLFSSSLSSRGHAKSSPCGSPTQLYSADSLPIEIFLEIGAFLRDADLLRLSLTASWLRTLLLPVMYRTLSLETSRACLSGLNTLLQHPELCIYVRSLTVRPNYAVVSWPRLDEPVQEIQVVLAIERLATKLKNLNEFVWGGSLPPPDCLWRTLRYICPELKKVSSTLGSKHLDPDSELLQFSNLTSFSAISSPLLWYGPGTYNIFNPSPKLPHQLLDMLLSRCPTLEELRLRLFHSSHSLHALDALTAAVYPNLRVLHVEMWVSTLDSASSQPAPEQFGRFLSAHPNLTELNIYPFTDDREGRLPAVLPLCLPPTALPCLTSFVGVYQHIAELPNVQSLETLDLTGEPVGSGSIDTVARVLRRLGSLRSLDIRLGDARNGVLLHAVVSACPGLATLRVMFPVNFGMKTLRQISHTLQLLPHLRSFTLYKRHKLTDDTMLCYALALLRDNPRLEELQLAWFSPERFERRQNGSYFLYKTNSELRKDTRGCGTWTCGSVGCGARIWGVGCMIGGSGIRWRGRVIGIYAGV